MCSDGHATGGSNSCHSCDDSKGKLLVAAGALCSIVLFLLLVLIVVYLIGGLDAVLIVRETVTRRVQASTKVWTAPRTSTGVRERPFPQRKSISEGSCSDSTPALDFGWEPPFLAADDADPRQNGKAELSPTINRHASSPHHDVREEWPTTRSYSGQAPTLQDRRRDKYHTADNEAAGPTGLAPSLSANIWADARPSGTGSQLRTSWLEGTKTQYTGPPSGAIRVENLICGMSGVLGSHDRDSKMPADCNREHTQSAGGAAPVETPAVGMSGMRGRHIWPPGGVIGEETPVGVSNVPGKHVRDEGRPASNLSRRLTGASAGDAGGTAQQASSRARQFDTTDPAGIKKSKCLGLGEIIKRWASKVPLDKFKIVVVVWQILTVFSGVAGVEYPSSYAKLLSWLNLVNLDIGEIFSASCVLPRVNFYARLLATTLTPFVLAAGLVLTYRIAIRRSAIGSAGVAGRRDAWSRHVTAGLLLTFLVSSTVLAFYCLIFWLNGRHVSAGLTLMFLVRPSLCGSVVSVFRIWRHVQSGFL